MPSPYRRRFRGPLCMNNLKWSSKYERSLKTSTSYGRPVRGIFRMGGFVKRLSLLLIAEL